MKKYKRNYHDYVDIPALPANSSPCLVRLHNAIKGYSLALSIAPSKYILNSYTKAIEEFRTKTITPIEPYSIPGLEDMEEDIRPPYLKNRSAF